MVNHLSAFLVLPFAGFRVMVFSSTMVYAEVMPTIAVLNQKGGCAKTTSCIYLGCALSAAGKKTTVIDLDRQGSAAEWWYQADDDNQTLPFDVEELTPRQFKKWAKDRTDEDEFVLLDTPPGDPEIRHMAEQAADFVILPASPSGLEIIQLMKTVDECEGNPMKVLITIAYAKTVTLRDMTAILDSEEVPRFESIVYHRQDIRRAFGNRPEDLHAYTDVAEELCEAVK